MCSMLWVFAIRGVRDSSPQLSLMNRSGVENSPSSSSIKPLRVYGEMVSSGTRNPSPMSSISFGSTWS